MTDQNEAFNALTLELRGGFAQLIDQARLTNERIDQTNQRLDQTNQRLDQTNALTLDLRSGFAQLIDQARLTNERIDQTNQRLDQTNQRLDQTNQCLEQTNVKLGEFRAEVSTKLDGIGVYLRSINGNISDHGDRLFKLERRVDDIDKRLGA